MRLVSIIGLSICLMAGKVASQPVYKASLPVVEVDTFYCIDLPYQVLGGARPDLADVRIIDSKGEEVAWLAREDTGFFNKRHLLEVPLRMSYDGVDKKKTRLQLIFPFKFQVEQLVFYISSPRYFRRELELVRPFSSRVFATLSNESGSPQAVTLGVYGDTLQLSIFNGDDRPLTVDSVKAYIRRSYLIAGLEKGGNYTLTYGDERLSFPQYDLSFAKQLPDSIERLVIGDIERQLSAPAKQEEPSAWLSFFKTYGIWIVILLIIVQLLYMVRKMIK